MEEAAPTDLYYAISYHMVRINKSSKAVQRQSFQPAFQDLF